MMTAQSFHVAVLRKFFQTLLFSYIVLETASIFLKNNLYQYLCIYILILNCILMIYCSTMIVAVRVE